MNRDQNTARNRTLALIVFALGFVLGLIAVWLYWLERRATLEVAETEEMEPLRVRVSPAAHEAEPDDLTCIEGIGPKMSSVLETAGIVTFEQLASSDVDALRQLLREEGLHFADPGTWPEQAALAAAGAWEALDDLQGELSRGRRVG